jgi:hypothetical protein
VHKVSRNSTNGFCTLNYVKPYAQNPTSSFFLKKNYPIWKKGFSDASFFKKDPSVFWLFFLEKRPKY